MKEILLWSATCLLLLCLHDVCAVDCSWDSWSPCSVECGNGTRTRQISQAATIDGQTCTGPLTEICIVTSCMATNLAASFLATVTMNSVYIANNAPSPGLVAELAIDGTSNNAFALCAATALSTNPWLRVDLKKEYFVSSVQAVLYPGKHKSVYVYVGNKLANNGNDNHNLGKIH
ncbi:uncharacterized protein LOC134185353 [Corticium candelabrum]|uniref:uncharacterized protein LOC134185353 n=1 Tax=Corticium candelabrum TaxID=121492 RepID=UPI002E274818|nr:uncharacterized protein LOC134185353 [Corticium candelabrum]